MEKGKLQNQNALMSIQKTGKQAFLPKYNVTRTYGL